VEESQQFRLGEIFVLMTSTFVNLWTTWDNACRSE